MEQFTVQIKPLTPLWTGGCQQEVLHFKRNRHHRKLKVVV